MRIASAITSLLAILAATSVARRPKHRRGDDGLFESLPGDKEKPVAVPGRYIVEFAPNTAGDQVLQDLDASHDYNVVKIFETDGLFFGATVEAKEGSVSAIEEDERIVRAWPVTRFKLDAGIDKTSFSQIVNGTGYRPHAMTGVDGLHRAGIRGKGAIVAVIDTGIDYTHPDLGGGMGPGFTVISGADLVGDGCWPKQNCPKEPDGDPMDHDGHGTHVAGIIAGQSKWFSGVAPEAKLRAYKVFAEGGWVSEDVLIEALLAAYEAGVDIITTSVGSPSGWRDSPWAIVADRIVDQGVVVTMAAGNDGAMGPFLMSNGAAARNALAVAAVEPDSLPEVALDVTFTEDGDSETSRVGHNGEGAPLPTRVRDWPLVHVGSGCNIPEDLNLTNKVVLVDENFCSAQTKEQEILSRGGEYVLLFSPENPDEDGLFNGDWRRITPAFLGDEQGRAMAAAISNGYNLTVTSPRQPQIIATPNPSKRIPAHYTTFGSTWDMSVKPDIAAPGSSILSLGLGHGYSILSGTSMATPYVAGIAALYISKFGGRAKHGSGFAKMLHSRILASGEFVPWANESGLPLESGLPAPVPLVGNGLVNATKVLRSDTQLSFAKFALNDTHHFSRFQGFEITNNGPRAVTYTFEIQPAGAFEAYKWIDGEAVALLQSEVESKPLRIVPKVKLPSGEQHLVPGKTKSVEFIFEIPQGTDPANIPVYSGKVVIKGSNGDILSVPYSGVGSNLLKESQKRMWYRAYDYPTLYSTTDLLPLDEKASFTFDLSVDKQDFMRAVFNVVFGSPEVRWDIFEPEWKERQWKYPPVVGENGYVGSATAWNWASDLPGTVFDPKKDNEDEVAALPLYRVVRASPYQIWWLGRLANGSDIRPGNYSMRIAALSPFGNPRASDNWDVWKTPMIEVLPKS